MNKKGQSRAQTPSKPYPPAMSLRASEPANSEYESASNEEEEASEEEASNEEEDVRRDLAKSPLSLPAEKQRDVVPMAVTRESEEEGSTQGEVEQQMLPSPAQNKRKSRPSVMPVRAARKRRTDADRREQIPVAENENNVKKRFERLWSEEDEIRMLKGLLEYTPRNKADMKVFYNVIKGSLRIQVSQSQLVKKIWKLKKKYTNKARTGKHGADPKFTNPHEEKIFKLSKKMWAKSAESSREVIGSEQSLRSCVRGFELIEASKKAELEDQRKTLETTELELYVERAKLEAKLAELDSKLAELSRKRTQLAVEERILVLEAYKSSTN